MDYQVSRVRWVRWPTVSSTSVVPVIGMDIRQCEPGPRANRRVGRWSLVLGGLGALCLVFAFAACTPPKDITSTKPYADLIGAKYSVVADDLYAYGVYESLSDKRVTLVELVPAGTIGGLEFAFRRKVPMGTVIRVLSAWLRYPLIERRAYYLVAMENWDLPPVPIRLYLDRGNEGAGADLNPAVYKKLPSDK